MKRKTGTTVRGIRCPIIRKGDNIAKMAIENIFETCKSENFSLRNRDVICLTESIIARAQGNYITIDDIVIDIKNKFKSEIELSSNEELSLGLAFPITSRNRFSLILKRISRAFKGHKIIILLKYPCDNFNNYLISLEDLDKNGIKPYRDVLDIKTFRKLFGIRYHEHTGVDYLDYYSKLVIEEGCQVDIILGNDPKEILKYTKYVIACDIHTRFRTKKLLKEKGALKVYGLDDILCESINGSGFNEKFGLIGSNKATEEKLKLFPRSEESLKIVLNIQKQILEKTGKNVEVMIYGDASWELVDPVVSPAFTEGLKGKLNELKIKYIADEKYGNLKGEELNEAIRRCIKEKEKDLKGKMSSEGTCPRSHIDLIGGLCDLTSGSGDKGTPIVLVQGYFDSYVDM